MSARPKVPLVARILLGLAFTVSGLTFFLHFLHFLPQPALPPAAGAFFSQLSAGQIMTVVKVFEVACGLALLANRFVPLALALLAPVEIGIFAYHAVFDPSGLPVIVLLMALTIYLAWAYRVAFAPMLRARVEPTAGDAVVTPHHTATV